MGMIQTSETRIKHHILGVSIPHKEFYCLCYNVLCIAIEKGQKKDSVKRFLKRNLADVGMGNKCTGRQSTQTRSAMHTVIYTPYQGHIIQ